MTQSTPSRQPRQQREHPDFRYSYSSDKDFANRDLAQPSPYWLQSPGPATWTIQKEGSQRCLAQSDPKLPLARAWLHLFDRNPVFKGSLKLESSTQSEATFSIFIRLNHIEGSFLRFDYQPDHKRLSLIEQEDPARPATTLAEVHIALDLHHWHRFEISANGAQIDFALDGKRILATEAARHQTFGRIGFETTHLAASLAHLDYQGREGRPAPGVTENDLRCPLDTYSRNSAGRPYWAVHMGIAPIAHGAEERLALLAHRFPNYADHWMQFPFVLARSSDGGASWTGLDPADRQVVTFTDGDWLYGAHPQILYLPSSELLALGFKSRPGLPFSMARHFKAPYVCAVSSDGGHTWQCRGDFHLPREVAEDPAMRQGLFGEVPAQFFTTMQGKLNRLADGTLTFPATRLLWVSEDDGRSWQIRSRAPHDHANGKGTSEPAFIDLPNGDWYMLSRTARGQTLAFSISRDRGKTWQPFQFDSLPFISSGCAFGVRRDPYEDQTYWVYWCYNDKRDEPSTPLQPRTRLALARSQDGMQSWQFLMDADDWGYPSYQAPITSINDPRILDYELESALKEGQLPYLQRDNRIANLAL